MENAEDEKKRKSSDATTKTDESNNSHVLNVELGYSVWKQIVLLHTKTVWKNYIIIFTVVIEFQLILYNISFRGTTAFTSEATFTDDYKYDRLAMDCVYLFDFFSAIVYRKWTNLSSTYGHPTRPILWLIIDVISLLPFEWIHRLITNHQDVRVSYLLGTNYLLRSYRLFEFHRFTRREVGERKVSVRIVIFVVVIFMITGAAVAALINAVDMVDLNPLSWLSLIEERSVYPTSEFDWCIISYYVVISQVTGHGIPEADPKNYSIAFIVIVLVNLWMLQAFEIAYLTDIVCQRDYGLSLFHREMRMVVSHLDDINASKDTKEKVKKYYNYVWKTQGNSKFEIMKFNMFPSIFLKECALELSWDAFKHSHLFRDQPIPFLRNLGTLFEREYYRPGEMIFEKYERKDRLIYIVSGVVQFLSEEDDKSPILSFSGGTILCESILILSHRSLCNVVAGTEVELNVLHRHKFVELVVYKYQSIYRTLQSRIRFRYWKALRMVTIGAALQKNKSHIVTVPACTDVAWLKQTLTVLQHRQNRIFTKKDKKDMQTETVFATTDFRYTFANLDMLVISDDIAIMTEQVCLNNGQLPWIFYPQSTVLNYWNGFVILSCLVLSTILPLHVSVTYYRVIELKFSMNILCFVYFLDLIIASTTAIHENDMVYTNVIDIISRRMYKVSYWADFVAAFPVDWILIGFGSEDEQVHAYWTLNRLVKVYKFEEFFSSIEHQMILSPYKIRVIKHTFYVLLISYFSMTFFLILTCPRGECDATHALKTFLATANKDLQSKGISLIFLIATQAIVGIGTNIIAPALTSEFFVNIPVLVIGAAILNYTISSVSASHKLRGLTKSWLRFNTINISLTMEKNNVGKSVQNRVFRYLEMEWVKNNAYTLTFHRKIFDTTAPKLRMEVRSERLFSLMKDVQLFEELQDDCIRELCAVCEIRLFPPKEVIGYRGTKCREMYIIEKGHCQVWRNVDMVPINVQRGKTLYVLEMFCDIQKIHTVTTVTHVNILKIKLEDVMMVFAKFPMQKTILMKIVNKFKKANEYEKLLNMQSALPKYDMMTEIQEKWDEVAELRITKTSPKNRDKVNKMEVEESSWKKTAIMLFLLKSTIKPDGRFIKIWEWFRCTCAFLLIATYSGDAVISQTLPQTITLFAVSFLNLTMVIDLYVRLHVQFYNSHKILVTDPISTSKNYIKSGLIVDLIAIFPLESFFIMQQMQNPKTLWIYRLNRLLMSHSIIGALKYHYAWSYMSKYINCVMFLPIIILMGHVLACGLLLELCEIGDHVKESDIFHKGIYCSPDKIELLYVAGEPITTVEMYVNSIVYIFAHLTRIGVVNFRPLNYAAIVFIMFLTLVSFFLTMVITTYTISTISRRDATLTAYQEQMTILISYLKEKKVSLEFRNEVVNYFEYFWILRRGTSIMKQLQLFPLTLKQDVLWSVYGPSLIKSPGFSKRHESFFRSLFNHVEVKFFSKGAEILTVNLVHSSVYFIHRGFTEAIGPDGSRIAVLGCGSVFGNFTGSATMRQTCSIVTRTHVEAIVIESTDFFDSMMRHPETRKSFLAAVALNSDYLRAETEIDEESDAKSQTNKKSSSFILLPNTVLVQAWEIFSVLVSCYLAFAICFYQVAVTQFTGHVLALVYVTDVTFVAKMILVFYTAYEDDLGDYVLDRTLIARRFRESKFGLYFHLVTLIPFELLCLFSSDSDTRWDFLPWLRLNRVARLILVINYFRAACNRLNINITRMRLFYTGVLLLSLIHTSSCLMIYIQKATTGETEGMEDLYVYVQIFYAVLKMFSVITSRTVPASIPEALFLTLLFLVFFTAHAMFIGEVCAVVDDNQFLMNEYERRIDFFKKRVTKMDLTYVLRHSAWSYVSKLWGMRSGQQTPRLMKEAPIHLQYEVLYEMYSHHLLKNEIFANLHEDFLRQLTFHFKNCVFFPGDKIANIGDVDQNIYFVEKGIVDVVHPSSSSNERNNDSQDHKDSNESSEIQHSILLAGQCFGLVQGLYQKIPHTADYSAKTTTHIVYLYRPDWAYLLKYFPVSSKNLYKSATSILRSNGLDVYV